MREKKGPSLGKIQVKNPHPRGPCAVKFEDRSHEETEDNSDGPEARHGTLPKTYTSSKRTTKLHSTRPRKNGYSRLRQQKSQTKEKFVVDSGASMHMVSKRDLNSAELETMRTSRSPTTGDEQTREATVYVKELDLFVTVTFLEETPAVLSGSSARIMGIPERCEEVQSDLLHDLPDRLQEFRDNLVDERKSFRATGKP